MRSTTERLEEEREREGRGSSACHVTYIPRPAAQIAEGADLRVRVRVADHVPSSNLATTIPLPALPLQRTPALTMVMIAIL